MNYGLQYKGSKNLIATKVLEHLPIAPVLVDLFCGGCAIAHAALLSGKFDKVIINDIEGDVSQLFLDAIQGKFENETRWISREDFFRLRETDSYVRYIWSFGNNGRDYLYSKIIEPYKRALHYAVFFGDFDELHRLCPLVADDAEKALQGINYRKERRIAIGKAIVAALRAKATIKDIETNPLYQSVTRDKWSGCLQSIRILQSLERLERLDSIQSIERYNIERHNTDYRNVELPDNCIVYCDPPYANTSHYGLNSRKFDNDAFWEWARHCKRPLYISEYKAPKDFLCLAEIPATSKIAAKASNSVTEKIFARESDLGYLGFLFL